jgi:hypothetical protein
MCARELALVQEGNGVTYMGRKMHLVKRADGSIAVAGITVWFRASEIGCFLLIDSSSKTDATLASLQHQPKCGKYWRRVCL